MTDCLTSPGLWLIDVASATSWTMLSGSRQAPHQVQVWTRLESNNDESSLFSTQRPLSSPVELPTRSPKASGRLASLVSVGEHTERGTGLIRRYAVVVMGLEQGRWWL